MQGAILLMGVLGVLTMAERFGGVGPDAFTPSGASTPGSATETAAARAGALTSEVFPLTMFAIFGMMLFPTTNDLIGMFVALEVLSLPLYILSGLARRRRLLSQEASLKYFLLGAFSSAFFLFGTALLYGYAGSVYFGDLSQGDRRRPAGDERPARARRVPRLRRPALQGRCGAVPRVDARRLPGRPDAGHRLHGRLHQGRGVRRDPAPGLRRPRHRPAGSGRNALVIVALLTMVVGSVLSVTQTDMKRLLAYSSIAHAGFILVGVLAFDQKGDRRGPLLPRRLRLLDHRGLRHRRRSCARTAAEATHLSQWAGLGKRHPLVAGAFAFLMLAFAGIPLTSGFVAKFGVFSAAIGTGGATGTVARGHRCPLQRDHRVRLRCGSSS